MFPSKTELEVIKSDGQEKLNEIIISWQELKNQSV